VGIEGNVTHKFVAGLYASTVFSCVAPALRLPPPIAYTQVPLSPATSFGQGAVAPARPSRVECMEGRVTHVLVAGLYASTVFNSLGDGWAPSLPPIAYTQVPLSPATLFGQGAVATAKSWRAVGMEGRVTHLFVAGLYASRVPTTPALSMPPIAYTQVSLSPATPFGQGAVAPARLVRAVCR
jgi:hypothetical protein